MLSGTSALLRLYYISKQVLPHFLYLLPIALTNFLICLIFWSEVKVNRHVHPDYIVPLEAFVTLHEVENSLLEVVTQVNLH